MKKWAVKYSIQNTIDKENNIITKRHNKKFANLMIEKSKKEGTVNNPNKILWNFSSHVLTSEEYQTLKFGLKHGLARKPDENEILASAEALWDQLETKGFLQSSSVLPTSSQKLHPCNGVQSCEYGG